ncbi:MAG: dCTP deaminase [Planctomycetia bacterium]|nr:dCTP deaminase [Planctomycetia bacterium]
MILADREIHAALERGAIVIDPDPRPQAGLWSSTSLDLRLGNEFTRWKEMPKGLDLCFDPNDPTFDFQAVEEQLSETFVIGAEGNRLKPGQFLLGWTLERVKLPEQSRIAARVEGKSSLARLGVGVHITAPTIHAGFGFNRDVPNAPARPIRLEIFHLGTIPVKLVPGMKVCQLIFEEVHGTPQKGYTGQFSAQEPKQN